MLIKSEKYSMQLLTGPACLAAEPSTILCRRHFWASVHCVVCMCSVAQLCPVLRPQGLQPARLLCPWDPPGENTGVAGHALLQGIFPTQG